MTRDWKWLLGVPAVAVTVLTVLYTAIAWVIRVGDVPAQLSQHQLAEKQYHDSASIRLREVDAHAESTQQMIEAVVRGECIENPREDLARQGLLKTCRALGIDR